MDFFRHIFEKKSNTKPHENPSCSKRTGMMNLLAAFAILRTRLKDTNNSVGQPRRSSIKKKYFGHCNGVRLELKHLHDFFNCRTEYCIAGGIIVLCAATMSSALRLAIWETEFTARQSVCDVEQNASTSVRLSRITGIKAQRII
jgi:hypothetical protein